MVFIEWQNDLLWLQFEEFYALRCFEADIVNKTDSRPHSERSNYPIFVSPPH